MHKISMGYRLFLRSQIYHLADLTGTLHHISMDNINELSLPSS